MHRKRLTYLFALLGIGTALAFFLYRPHWQSHTSPFPIAISRMDVPHSGLLHIAEAKGFFTEEGLAAIMRTSSTGYEAIQELLRGETDVGVAAETPIAKTLAEGKQIKVIATIFTSSMNVGIVARKDRGITEPQDLKGKRIGVVFGTATHYMLETFLAFHRIPVDAVTIVATKPEALEADLTSGELDAAATWNPHLTQVQQQLGGNAQTFYPDKFYAETYNLVVRPDYLSKKRETVDRLLRALLKAESFASSHPNEANRIIASASGADPSPQRGSREPLTYELSLKQSLLLATENEVNWHFRRGLVQEGPFPDILNAFAPEPLRALKPSGVSILK
ncbi:ABC transporter substrate-binding protein [Desulfocurvibacter africanus]|uniref:ABC-type transporter, periplasmic subunit family 3 n=1 Tax=Desulfocurvibacter africanus subsp. africanus str. Walvis Bay TaxID=690850 RepID=F3YZW1_DESAF|nr:ABC transporter substrate-binding protein [Desulfocurvibacter africanus]EGJ50916.1 ABC-type transporter, periplasmic subunit family 3 [Desulfocurvibacter africanus subsp. africanus str. Walvis Bay]